MVAFLICLGALLLLFCLLMLVTHLIIKERFGHRVSYPTASAEDRFDAYSTRYDRERHCFFSGKNRLTGYLYGKENTRGLVVFAHGIGAGHESYIKELLWLVDHGWRVFAYDATGSCESEGEGTVGLVQSALDLHAALTYVESKDEWRSLPICVMGHSWGGYAAAAVLNFEHDIKASVSISGYNDPVEMMMAFAKHAMSRATVLLYPFVKLDNRFTFGKNASLTAIDGINKAVIPVMLVHGTEDDLVTPNETGVIAHRVEITDPHLKLYPIAADGQNGHVSIFFAKESLSHRRAVDEAYKPLQKRYNGKVPDEEKKTFFDANVDRKLYNLPNQELMQEIDTFLAEAIKNEKSGK